MNPIRKFILRFFALSYVFKFKNKLFNLKAGFTRSANIIFPLFAFTMVALNEEWKTVSLITISLLILTMLISFLYLDIYPIKQSEYDFLDDVQKDGYDTYHNVINDRPKSYNGLFAFIINPIVFISLITYFFVKYN